MKKSRVIKREQELEMGLRLNFQSLKGFRDRQSVMSLNPYEIRKEEDIIIASYRKDNRSTSDSLLSFAFYIAKNRFSRNRVIPDNIKAYLERKRMLLMR